MKTMIASLSLLAFVSVAWGGSGFPYQVANTEEINAINLSDLKRSASNRYTFSANYIAGNITVGHSGVLNYRFVNYNFAPEATEIMGTLSISGSPDFALTSDACSGVTLNPGQSCLVQVTFTPSSKSTMQAALSIPWDTYGTDPSLPWHDPSFGTMNFLGSGLDRPPEVACPVSGSIINVEKQTLGEEIPLTGIDFGLYYTSLRAAEYISTTAQYPSVAWFNNEGWTLGVHHTFAPGQSRLFLGTGEVLERRPILLSNQNWMTPKSDGSEVYIFSYQGKHLETRTGLMGALKYSFGYDSNSRLTSITDAYGNQVIIARNGSGKMTSITAPHGQVTTVTTNSNGLLSGVTNPNSESYQMTYKTVSGTGTGLLETFTKPGGQVSTFTYDSNGMLTKDLGNGGDFWAIIAGVGGLTKKSNLNRSTTYNTAFDSNGHFNRTLTDPSGMATTSTEYVSGSYGGWNSIESYGNTVMDDERFGRSLTREASSSLTYGSTTRTTTYAQSVSYPTGVTPDPFNFSMLTKTTSTGAMDSVEVYNSTTREKTVTSDEGATSKTTYDANERPISFQIGSDTATTISYDSSGRLARTVQGTYNQKTYAYNSAGFLQSVTNGLSEVTSYFYDLAGRLTSVTLPDTRVIQYSYDANGNMTGVTPPSRPLHAFTFNAFELPSEYQPPTLTGVSVVNTQYTYNMDKQLTLITRPTGDTAAFNYNSTTGLLSNITLAGGTNSYTYQTNTDLISRIDSADGIRSNYTYYGRNIATEEQRKTATDFLVGKVTRTYDWAHRVSNITTQGNASSPNLSTSITYNNDSQPTSIGGMALTYSYPSGRLATTAFDKISDSRTYDTYGNLSGYSAYYNPTSGSPVLLYSYTLTRDTLHRITSKTETIGGVTTLYDYDYDSVGRLEGVYVNSVLSAAYTFDTNGNRTSGSGSGASFTATFDDQDRQLTQSTLTYTHNANGDRTQRVTPGTGNTDYTWDAIGNLKTYTTPTGSVFSYGYDGENRLVMRKTGTTVNYRYVYADDYRILAKTTDAGVISQVYQYGTHINTPDTFYNGSWYRIITDHLGSPRLVVRASDGVIGQRMDYNVFGRVTNDTSPGFQAYGFAGGIYFPTEALVKFGARFYDPVPGRWISKDPILFGGGSANLFGYVANDPINFMDPSGLKLWFADKNSAKLLKSAIKTIMKSSAGRALLSKLHKSDKIYLIKAQCGFNDAEADGNNVTLDPNFHPSINTDSGPQDASTARILAHELGHLAGGEDEGTPSSMGNINQFENPIMSPIEGYNRISY